MDTAHLWAAMRYAELNPVRVGLARAAEEWRWSGAAAGLRVARRAVASYKTSVYCDPEASDLKDFGKLPQNLFKIEFLPEK
jgi:hypothetical protein